MRTALLLCSISVVTAALMTGMSALQGNWTAFAPWLALVFCNLAHLANVLSEVRRQQRRQRAEVELRAMFGPAHREHSHERQERAAALRGMRS